MAPAPEDTHKLAEDSKNSQTAQSQSSESGYETQPFESVGENISKISDWN